MRAYIAPPSQNAHLRGQDRNACLSTPGTDRKPLHEDVTPLAHRQVGG
jgi:hypothetical protein